MNPRYFHKEERKVELFTVTANSCDTPSRSVIFKDLDIHKALMVADILAEGIRDVDVVSQESGEVYYKKYQAEEIFHPHGRSFSVVVALAEYALLSR